MTARTTTRIRRTAGIIALGGAGLLVLFWALYFGGIIELGETGSVITEFEAAFPFADAVLAATLLAAGFGLLRSHPYGAFCLSAGGAATLYLGLLDLTFYSRQGLYWPLTLTGTVELAVNLICIGGGITALALGWKLRDAVSVGAHPRTAASPVATIQAAGAPGRARALREVSRVA